MGLNCGGAPEGGWAGSAKLLNFSCEFRKRDGAGRSVVPSRRGSNGRWGGRQDGRHAIGYDLSWRCLKDPSLKASPSVETQIGNKLKSAVRYTFQTRTLDNRLFPTQGWSFR